MIVFVPPMTDKDEARLAACQNAIIEVVVQHFPNLNGCPEHGGDGPRLCACRTRSTASVLELLTNVKSAFARALGIVRELTDYREVKPSDIFGEC
jgi:hypothetical protein